MSMLSRIGQGGYKEPKIVASRRSLVTLVRLFLLTHWKQKPHFRGLRSDQKGYKGRQWEHTTLLGSLTVK